MNAKAKPVNKSLGSLVISAALAVMAGALVSCGRLVAQDIPSASSGGDQSALPYAIRTGAAYGRMDLQKDAEAMLAGTPGRYELGEGDVNQLLRSWLKLKDKDEVKYYLSEAPNVHIGKDGTVSVNLRVNSQRANKNRVFVYQVRGHIEKNGFHPDMGWLGRSPIPLMNSAMMASLKPSYDMGDNAMALRKLVRTASFSLENGKIVVEIPEKQ